MLPRCQKCSKKLSLRWFLTSFVETKCRCTKCNTLHEFTRRRGFVTFYCAVMIIFCMQLFDETIQDGELRFLLFTVVILAIGSLVPGQYRLSSHQSSE